MAQWNESEHPRDNDGKFTDKGAGASGTAKTSIERVRNVFEAKKEFESVAKNANKGYNKNVKRLKDIAFSRTYADFALQDPESIRVHKNIESKKYYELDDLYKLPVFNRIENKIAEYQNKYGNTYDINTSQRVQQRKQWVSDFLKGNGVDTMPYGGGPLKKEYKATIVVGLPAAGKSTMIANPLSKEQGAFIMDSDEMKKLIPEYKETNGGAADPVHDESKELMKLAFNTFIQGENQGVNMVIPIIGDKANKMGDQYIKNLIKAGYNIEIAYKRADTKESANRVVSRAIKDGRFIPKEVVMGYDDNAIRKAYKEVLSTEYNGKKVKRSKFSEI